MYGKISENGVLERAPLIIRQGKQLVKPTDEMLIKLGYLPVEHTPAPLELYPDKHFEFYWIEESGKIIQRWKLVDNPVYPPTVAELTAELITMQINYFDLPRKQALHFALLYPKFSDLIGQCEKHGYRFTYDGVLYAVAQPELTFEAHRPPGEGTESLYERVDNMHDGTLDDPIPAAVNMEVFEGLYYIEKGDIYKCIRSSEQPLQHLPSQLIGIYFERSEANG